MPRRKVRLGYIDDDSKRKATYKKRRNGLMKKADEISTLCGVNACAIVCSPYEKHAAVWPDDPEARRVISLFEQVPELERNRYMLDCKALLLRRLEKRKEQLERQVIDNRKDEMHILLNECLASGVPQDLMMNDLCELEEMVGERMRDVDEKIAALKRYQMHQGEALGMHQGEASGMHQGEASRHAQFQGVQEERHAQFQAVQEERHAQFQAVQVDRHAQLQAVQVERNAPFQGVQVERNAQFQAVQVENQDMGLAVDEVELRPQWVTDWLNAPDDVLFP